jgi:hypothetical protein
MGYFDYAVTGLFPPSGFSSEQPSHSPYLTSPKSTISPTSNHAPPCVTPKSESEVNETNDTLLEKYCGKIQMYILYFYNIGSLKTFVIL